MKTEIPEKIYVVIDPIWGSMRVNYNRNDADNIEYTRTDGFIEKVCDYLRTHLEMTGKELFIENLKAYFEG